MPDLKDGESVEVKGSGSKPYVLKNVGGAGLLPSAEPQRFCSSSYQTGVGRVIVDLAELRQALVNIALPADAQIRLFAVKDSAATELARAFEVVHSSADVPRAEWLPAETRQALDELTYHLAMCYPLMYADYPVDDRSDGFLRDSDFWAEARDRARDALELLDRVG